MSKAKSALILLPLLALIAVSTMNVNAQRGGNGGGGKKGGGGSNCSSGQGGYMDYPVAGEYTKIYYAECNGVGSVGVSVTWWAIYNYGANQCYITTTGSSCIGTVLSIQLYTNSTGYASLTLIPSQPAGSWSLTAH